MEKTGEKFLFEIQNGLIDASESEDSPIAVYINPTPAQRETLVSWHSLDEHTLTSALDPDETARLEFEPEHTAIILKRPDNVLANGNLDDFGVVSMGIFLFKDRLIAVKSDNGPLFRPGRPLFKCDSLRGAMLHLIYHSIAQFMANIRVINQMSNSIEEHISHSLGNQALSKMFVLQKSLVYYQSALHSNNLMLFKLKVNAGRIGFSTEEQEFLDDIQVENEQCLKLVEIYTSILTGMSDARVSIISNNLAVIMKKLTVISIVFMPLNILASMGGMSEWTMMTTGIPWPVAYGIFAAMLLVIGYATWLVVRKIGIEDTSKPGLPWFSPDKLGRWRNGGKH
jgi:magnesium transporter